MCIIVNNVVIFYVLLFKVIILISGMHITG